MNGNALIFGGGGVCFPTGSVLNSQWYQILPSSAQPILLKPVAPKPIESVLPDVSTPPKIVQIPSIVAENAAHLRNRLYEMKPIILRGTDFGPCTKLWDLDYLKAKIGSDRRISIHLAETRDLSFKPKNFIYTTLEFSDFANLLDQGKHVYLRALAAESEAFNRPANFWRDFPTIGSDFKIPAQLEEFARDRLHSSVFRLSGDVSMWLHYDCCSNFLFQAKGCKRLLLFPPEDVLRLGFEPNQTTSWSFDKLEKVKDTWPAALNGTTVHEGILEEGDIVFIPRLWLHSTGPGRIPSVAVNVFWQDLEPKFYTCKDIYSSKDLRAYTQGMLIVNRLIARGGDLKSLATDLETGVVKGEIKKVRGLMKDLPADVVSFYLRRLADQLRRAYKT